jgi:hypothetical protein
MAWRWRSLAVVCLSYTSYTGIKVIVTWPRKFFKKLEISFIMTRIISQEGFSACKLLSAGMVQCYTAFFSFHFKMNKSYFSFLHEPPLSEHHDSVVNYILRHWHHLTRTTQVTYFCSREDSWYKQFKYQCYKRNNNRIQTENYFQMLSYSHFVLFVTQP